MRVVAIWGLGILALVCALVGFLISDSQVKLNTRGFSDPTQDLNLPYKQYRLGVNADLTQYKSESLLRQEFDQMVEAGIQWVRQPVYWSAIETRPNTYNWATYDQIAATLEDYPQLSLIPFIVDAPIWERAPHDDAASYVPPQDYIAWRSFVSEFARRYGHLINHYQIWDEPNLADAWGGIAISIPDYSALLCEAYNAIKSYDSDANIISAALAPTIEVSQKNLRDDLYLQGLYNLDIDQCFDAVASKPYGFNTTPYDRTVSADVLNFSRIILLREIMVENNDGRKPLWASNFGWNYLPDDWDGEPSIWGSVSQLEQEAFTMSAIERAEKEWPWLSGLILENWHPDLETNDPWWGFSLKTPENSPTPLLESLMSDPPEDIATNGLFHPITGFARYSGLWTFSELGADIGWLETSDSAVEFDFQGTDVAILAREGNYFAFLYPTIDSNPPQLTPNDNQGNAYIFLRSQSGLPEISLKTIDRELPLTDHTLHIVADKGWDQWALAGFAVSNGDLSKPYIQQNHMAMITLAISGVLTTLSSASLISSLARQSIITHLNFFWHLVIASITSLALMIGLLLTWNNAVPELLKKDSVNLSLSLLISGGILLLNPGFILTLLSTIVLFWLFFLEIKSALFLVVLWAPFFLFPVELYTYNFPVVEYLVIIASFAWLLRFLIDYREIFIQNKQIEFWTNVKQQINRFDWLMLAYLILGALALVWSVDKTRAFTEYRTFFIEPAIFYGLARVSNLSRQNILGMFGAVLLGGLLVAIIGLVQYTTGQSVIIAENGARRLASVYGSPNNVGLYLNKVIPLSLVILVLYKNRIYRLMIVISMLTMLIALLLTQSIGAIILGLPSGLAITLALIWGKRPNRRLVVLLSGMLIVVLFLIVQSPRIGNLFDLTSGTGFLRLRVWESTVEILSENWLTGLGLDQFLAVYSSEYIRPDAIFDPDLSHPHNVILDFWVRLGLPGVMFLIILIAVFTKAMHRVLMSSSHELRIISAGISGCFASIMIHGLIDNSIFVLDLIYIFVLLMVSSAQLVNMRAIDVSLE